MAKTRDSGPIVRADAPDDETPRRARWPRVLGVTAGVVALAAIGGLWWGRSRRSRRRVEDKLSPLSQEWLAEHYYQTGQRGDDT